MERSPNKRKWVYAKKPSGTWYTRRQYVGYLLLAFLFAGPFIKISGEPLLMLNILDRKFVLFGMAFYPQDMHLFVFAMLIFIVCVVLFSIVYGRVWCGWACPQTIFMELLFRRIEYWLEGDAHHQKKQHKKNRSLFSQPKKMLKHVLFFSLSFWIANTFLAYVIGIETLLSIITDPIGNHIGGLMAILLFTTVFYLVFAYARELVCTVICPYGRLQGVMLDDKSLTVAYDYRRGEPRGKIAKKESISTIGDCVDCKLCVQVCPTGIDIRNGIQMECINCTACMDACDAVMEKLHKPKRLIGFYSIREMSSGTKKNTRAIVYTALLTVLIAVLGWLLFSRSLLDATLLRAKGTGYIYAPDGTVRNLYNLELINKSNAPIAFNLRPDDTTYKIQLVNPVDQLNKGEKRQVSFFVLRDKNHVDTYKSTVRIDIQTAGKTIEKLKTTFIAPPTK